MKNLACVIGSNGGIGKDIVNSFLNHGYKVVGFDLYNEIDVDNFYFIKTDLNNINDINSLDFKDIEFSQYTVLINAAGVREITPLLELELHEWEKVLTINLTAPFLISRNFSRKIINQEKQGCIINIASVSGMLGEPERTAYVSSKHALIGLTKQFAVEFGRLGIRCNSVSPAITRTKMTEHYFEDPIIMEKIRNGLYSNRVGTPKDISSVVLLIADKNSEFINGSNFVIDGGWTCGKDL